LVNDTQENGGRDQVSANAFFEITTQGPIADALQNDFVSDLVPPLDPANTADASPAKAVVLVAHTV